jgi:hypothetical protein
LTTWQPTIGVFAGIFDREGNLLVKRREPKEKTYVGDYDLPGGGIEAEAALKAIDEGLIGQELGREVWEELHLNIPTPQRMPALYPAVSAQGKDLALAIIIGVVDELSSRGRYISPRELWELSRNPEGSRIVSGWGKRMCRLCLRMFVSRDCPNPEYRKQAAEMLKSIQEGREYKI